MLLTKILLDNKEKTAFTAYILRARSILRSTVFRRV